MDGPNECDRSRSSVEVGEVGAVHARMGKWWKGWKLRGSYVCELVDASTSCREKCAV